LGQATAQAYAETNGIPYWAKPPLRHTPKQTVFRMSAAERTRQQEPKYRELIRITGQVVNNARQVVEKAKAAASGAGVDLITSVAIDSLRNQIAGYCKLADRVIDQSRRRVLQGEKVPTEEKIYSIFEPHTDLIKRGKAQKPVEFGHKVFLAESAQGLITDYQVLDGNPSDTDHVQSSLDRHKQTFGIPPELCATDRGFFSAENVQYAEKARIPSLDPAARRTQDGRAGRSGAQ
jgi:IS5 family transposase